MSGAKSINAPVRELVEIVEFVTNVDYYVEAVEGGREFLLTRDEVEVLSLTSPDR